MKFLRKFFKIILGFIFIVSFFFFFDSYPKLQNITPYILITILYIRYDTKLENMSMDLLAAEEQIEELSNGEWTIDTRFRGNPYEA